MKRNNLKTVQLWLSVSELDLVLNLVTKRNAGNQVVDSNCRTSPEAAFTADLKKYLESKAEAQNATT